MNSLGKIFTVVIVGLLIVNVSIGQCPEKKWLWARLVYLRDSSSTSPTEKVKELLQYEQQLKKCDNKFDSTRALLLQRIGASYFFLSEYVKASEFMKASIDGISAHAYEPGVNLRHNIRNYYSLAWIYDSLGNALGKIRAIDSCIALASRFNLVDLYFLRALLARVEYSFQIGDYRRCVDYSLLCDKYSFQYARDKKLGRDLVVAGEENALVSSLLRVNAFLMLKDYDAAEQVLENKIEDCKKEGLQRHLVTIYSQLAEVQLNKGNVSKALVDYNLALRYSRNIKYAVGCKSILGNIGYKIYFESLANNEIALAYCHQALTQVNSDEQLRQSDAFETLNVLGNIAVIHAQKKAYDSSYWYFRSALNQINIGTTETALINSSTEDFLKNQDVYYLVKLLIDEADTYFSEFKDSRKRSLLNEAIRLYKLADRFLDKIKNQQVDIESKLFWRNDSRRMFEHAIAACYQNESLEDAFYFFEKSRAVLLQDQLQQQRIVNDGQLLQQALVTKKIRQLKETLEKPDISPGDRSQIQDEIFNNQERLDSLLASIKANNPLYYQNFVDTNFIGVTDVRSKILKNHDAVVELFNGENATYFLIITRTRIFLKEIDKRIYDSLSSLFIDYVSNADLINHNFSSFSQSSQALYHLLFAGVQLPTGRIVISPDGKYFPFEALLQGEHSTDYFLYNHAVSYTYSARYLLNDFGSTNSRDAQVFIGIAPIRISGFPDLTGSDQSLEKINRNFYESVNLVGPQASKGNFTREFYKYRIIQLYTHATDSGYNREPTIWFSDSTLTVSELLPEQHPITNLVVLSACQTASGKLYNGEGVFNFNRQFATLGIPSSVSNLWRVDAKSTYRLTELFYKHVAKGMPLDVAMQQAKREFLEEESDIESRLPFYWAAPILVGKSDAVALEKRSTWFWTGIVAGAFLCLFVGWIYWTRGRRH